MFEITHSGSWPAVVRPIVEKVNAWYAVLFLTYITLVVFAVIRIVTALFLKAEPTTFSTWKDNNDPNDAKRWEYLRTQRMQKTCYQLSNEIAVAPLFLQCLS